jgi:hypothetical protein
VAPPPPPATSCAWARPTSRPSWPIPRCPGLAAAELGGEAAREQVDALLDKGRDLLDSAAELIRERPLASFGVAFAAGWLVAALSRRDR